MPATSSCRIAWLRRSRRGRTTRISSNRKREAGYALRPDANPRRLEGTAAARMDCHHHGSSRSGWTCQNGQTHHNHRVSESRFPKMTRHPVLPPETSYALEVDGRIKTEFSTREGAERGAVELKQRFPMLQIRV